MENTVIVQNKSELKRAIENGAEQIVITDADLARNIKLVKSASKVVISTLCVGLGGVVACNIWNPIGSFLSASVVGVSALTGGGAVTIAVVAIGVAVIYAIYNDYEEISVEMPGAKLCLRKKSKRENN